MALARMVGVLGGAWRLADRWSVADFDAPGISVREQVERLDYALLQSRLGIGDPGSLTEIEWAQAECQQLLRSGLLVGEAPAEARVPQRVARLRRVTAQHEGSLARLNRRYWWMPFLIGLALMLVCWLCPLLPAVGPFL